MAQTLAINPNSGPEGSTVSVQYTEAADPGPTARLDTFYFDFGDGTGIGFTNTLQSSFNLSHQYMDNRPYTVHVYEANIEGEEYNSSAPVNIFNVPPDFGLPSSFMIANGQSLQYSGSFNDPGADAWTAIVNYGDGSPVAVASPGSSHAFTLDHNYPGVGSYTLTVTIRDDDGGQLTRNATVTVQPHSEPVELSIYTFAGLVITGRTGAHYDIQKTDNLQSSNWTTITNLTLTNNPQLWIDLNSTNSPNRFYRAVQATGGG